MSTSKKISEDPVCVKICRRVDSKNYLELFNVSWLSIRECEIRDPEFSVEDHRAYFNTVVWNTYVRGKKGSKLKPFIDWGLGEHTDEHDDPLDDTNYFDLASFYFKDAGGVEFEWCIADLVAWCEKKTEDEDDMFYRELLTLHHRCKFNRDAIELTGMKKDDFYKYLKEAKQRFKNDLIASRNIDDTRRDDLV